MTEKDMRLKSMSLRESTDWVRTDSKQSISYKKIRLHKRMKKRSSK